MYLIFKLIILKSLVKEKILCMFLTFPIINMVVVPIPFRIEKYQRVNPYVAYIQIEKILTAFLHSSPST